MPLSRLALLVPLLPLIAACDLTGDTLMDAIQKGDKAQVLAQLQKHPSLASMYYSKRNTHAHSRPLSEAAYHGNVDIMKLLLEYGADVNGTNRAFESALHVAAREGHVPAVEWLIAHGAAVNAVDGSGRTPLHYGAMYHAAAIQPLIDHGAAVGKTDQNGDTPLHIAATMTGLRTAIALCANGADSRARNHKGQTPADLPDGRAPELRLWLADDGGCTRLAAHFQQTKSVSAEAQRVALAEYDCETLRHGFLDVTRGLDKPALAQRCTAFGRALETGTGVDVDAAHAQTVYQLACDNGDARGCERLARAQRKVTGRK